MKPSTIPDVIFKFLFFFFSIIAVLQSILIIAKQNSQSKNFQLLKEWLSYKLNQSYRKKVFFCFFCFSHQLTSMTSGYTTFFQPYHLSNPFPYSLPFLKDQLSFSTQLHIAMRSDFNIYFDKPNTLAPSFQTFTSASESMPIDLAINSFTLTNLQKFCSLISSGYLLISYLISSSQPVSSVYNLPALFGPKGKDFK